MINKLTKAQETKVSVYLKEWLDNGRKVGSIDQKKAKEAIAQIYECAGIKPPKNYFFFPSPIQCQLACNIMKSKEFEKVMGDKTNLGTNLETNLWTNLGTNLGTNLETNLGTNLWSNLGTNLRSNLGTNLWSNLGTNLWSNLWTNLETNLRTNLETNLETNLGTNLWSNLETNLETNLRSNLWSNLETNLGTNLWTNLWSNLRSIKLEYENIFWGNHWTYWVGFYDFVLNELFEDKIKDHKSFITYLEAVQNIHLFIPFEDIVFISDYPKELNLNQTGQLHSFDAPSMMYEDGYSLFYISGVKVPKYAIETDRDAFTKEQILSETNVDTRRCIIQKIGIEKAVKLLGAETVDSFESEVGGRYELLMIDYDGRGNKRPYLKMSSRSIDADHIEGVAPQVKSVKEAICFRNKLKKFQEPEMLS